MKLCIPKYLLLFACSVMLLSSCMVLDGSSGYRTKNKCCGIIKCDMHRRSQKMKHKRTVNGHKSLQKREQRIKRGY